MADDLNTPLGQGEKKRRFALKIPITFPQALAGGLGLALGTFVLWTAFANDPYGGEPVMIVTAGIPTPPAVKTPEGADATPPKPGTAAPPTDTHTVTIINGMSGKREQVVIAGGTVQNDQQGGERRRQTQLGTHPVHIRAQELHTHPDRKAGDHRATR